MFSASATPFIKTVARTAHSSALGWRSCLVYISYHSAALERRSENSSESACEAAMARGNPAGTVIR